MMHVLPCDRVREDLAAYCDGELPMDDRVLVHGHLQECVACRLEEQAISDLGHALRTMAGSVPGRAAHDNGRLTGAILERIRVEQQFSLGSRVRALFEDMHFVWAGLGASIAMLFCIFASAGVLQAANQEKPDSLAGIISTIANADSNDPIRLASAVIENRALLDTTETIQTTDEDAELMLSALVTRDGRIQNLEVLEQQARALHIRPELVGAMLDAASRARFEPAQSGGLPVAVNVVWLVTATTVKGQPDYDLYLVRPPRWNGSAGVTGPGLPVKRPVPTVKPSVAGDDGLTAA
jgi:hypothetical protein